VSAYVEGDAVRVRAIRTVGHSRIPTYARGKSATVERVLEKFVIPEDEAWGRLDGRKMTLYRVRIPMRDVWKDYKGGRADTLDFEVFEHWLTGETEGKQ
jgi:hypothetical protein